MASVDLYNTSAFLKLAGDAGKAGLTAAAITLTRQIKRTVNLGGPGAPSKPGEPPHKQTALLYNSWQPEAAKGEVLGEMTSRAFTHNPYAAFLEFGTSKMAPRPYVQRSIRDSATANQRAFNAAFTRVFNATVPGGVR